MITNHLLVFIKFLQTLLIIARSESKMKVDALTLVSQSLINYTLMENMLNCNFLLFFCWLVRAHNVSTIATICDLGLSNIA